MGEPAKPKTDDPFAPNPALSMKDSFSPMQRKDPFLSNSKYPYGMNQYKDPFNSSQQIKDPFSCNSVQKNPFESSSEATQQTAFKDSGLSLGLKSLNAQSKKGAQNMCNPFKGTVASPFTNSNYFLTGCSPSAFTPSKQGYSIRGTTRARETPHSPAMFQTPTSKGIYNQKFGDMSVKRDETGSFGASPKDISTTKAVIYQQSKMPNKEYELLTPSQQNLRPMHNNNFFSNSPAYGLNNPYNPFCGNYANTPTGGSFSASPGGNWIFNIQNAASPHTGTAQQQQFINMQINEFQQNKNNETNQDQSPKFNSISDNTNKNYMNIKKSMNHNYPMSDVNAFSFSWKSGRYKYLTSNIIL